MRLCKKCGFNIEHKRPQAKYCSKKCSDAGRIRKSRKRVPYSEFPEETKIRLRRKAVERRNKAKERDGEVFRRKQREATARYRNKNREKHLAYRRLKEGATGKSKEEYLRDIRNNMKQKADLAETNAKQAWRYWLKQKAPDRWMVDYYAAMGKPWSNPRITKAEAYKLRYNLDVGFNLSERIRRQATKARKRDGIAEIIRAGLRNRGESRKLREKLGYSMEELRCHIERQFTKGMKWSAYMEGKIHIDHIIPQSSFDTLDDEDWRACWSLTNLRPLWAADNLAKSNKLESLL